jgi:hypothetical protein
MAFVELQTAHGREVLEAIEEENRILKLLFCYEQGAITPMEFVHRVREAV